MIITSFYLRFFNILAIVFSVFAAGAGFQSANAQMSKPGYDDKLLFRGITGVTIGGVQQQWTLKGYGTISQQSVPVSFMIPLSNRMLFTASNSGMLTSSDTVKVRGIVDTRLSLSYVLPGDKLWLTGGVSIPTGKTELTLEEVKVTSIISQTAFGYRVPVFGQGFSSNAGIAYATSITRRIVFGIGTSFFYKGKYNPISISGSSTQIEYDPGDEVSTNIGVDYITSSKVARFSTDLTVTYFLEDKLNSEKIFQSGPRFIALLVYSLRTGDVNHMVNARVRYRLHNTFYSGTTTTKYDAATQIEGQYAVAVPLYEWVTGTAVGEFKYYTADQIPVGGQIVETGKAEIGSFGADFLFHLNGIVTPTLNVRYSAGKVTIDDVSRAVNGFEAGIGVKVSF